MPCAHTHTHTHARTHTHTAELLWALLYLINPNSESICSDVLVNTEETKIGKPTAHDDKHSSPIIEGNHSWITLTHTHTFYLVSAGVKF